MKNLGMIIGLIGFFGFLIVGVISAFSINLLFGLMGLFLGMYILGIIIDKSS